MDARHTASAIARVRRLEGSRTPSERLFEDPYASLFEDTALDVKELFESIPFFEAHVRVRTRFFDDAVRSAVARGARRIVLVGAGYDARALRMPELRPPVRVIEIDHEDQIAAKQRRFAQAGIALPANLSFGAADLLREGAFESGLARAGLSDAAETLWICEGLFGYLSMPAISDIAATTAKLSLPGSMLVANHNVFSWKPSALAEVFTAGGWRSERAPSFDELHRKWIGGAEAPPDAEQFALLVVSR